MPNEEFGRQLKEAMNGLGLKQAARMTGFSHTALIDWREGKVPTKPDTVRQLADRLKSSRVALLTAAGYVPTDEDLEFDRRHYPNRYDEGNAVPAHLVPFLRLGSIQAIPHKPVYGKVPCGDPSAESQEEPVDLPVKLGADFILQVHGDSMEPHYHDGDLLVIRLTKSPEVGKNAVGIVEGEIFCKKFAGIEEKDGITFYRLEPTNHKYKAIRSSEVDFQGQITHKVIPT
jgi:SOS-response transcriptional repressor LexA